MGVYYQYIALHEVPTTLMRQIMAHPRHALRAIHNTARESKTLLAMTTVQTAPYPPVDTGAYLRSWMSYYLPNGADVQNDSRQAAVLEEGSKPYMMSNEGIQNVARWVLRKARKGAGKKRSKRKSAFKKASQARRERIYGPSASVNASRSAFGGKIFRAAKRGGANAAWNAALRIAWGIALKFKREGFRPRLVMKRTLPPIFRLLERNVREELEKAAQTR